MKFKELLEAVMNKPVEELKELLIDALDFSELLDGAYDGEDNRFILEELADKEVIVNDTESPFYKKKNEN